MSDKPTTLAEFIAKEFTDVYKEITELHARLNNLGGQVDTLIKMLAEQKNINDDAINSALKHADAICAIGEQVNTLTREVYADRFETPGREESDNGPH